MQDDGKYEPVHIGGDVRIFRHNFVGDKAKIRRRAVALQGFLTQSPAKFDEKTCMNPYVDRFYVRRFSAKPSGGLCAVSPIVCTAPGKAELQSFIIGVIFDWTKI